MFLTDFDFEPFINFYNKCSTMYYYENQQISVESLLSTLK